jgi:hypothetical protein
MQTTFLLSEPATIPPHGSCSPHHHYHYDPHYHQPKYEMNYLFPLDEPEGISEKRGALCSQHGVKETDEIADLLFLFVPHKGCLVQTVRS